MCKKTCNTAVQLQSALSQLAAVRRENDNQSAIIAAHQRDLADRDAEIATLKRARDHQAETITKYHDQDKHQLERIADLEMGHDILKQLEAAHMKDYDELVARREECEKLGAEVSDLRRLNAVLVESRDRAQAELDGMTGQRDGALVNAKAARNECDKLAAELKQMTSWRELEASERAMADGRCQRVQIELDKARAIILNSGCAGTLHHAEQRLADKSGECRALTDELRKVRGALEAERGIVSRMGGEHLILRNEIAELQEYGADRDQEIARLRHDVAERARCEGRVAAMLSAAPECHCDDLQEQLANLHRSGKALIDSLDGSPMPYGLVAFIQSHTRAGDALEELAHE